MRLFLRSEYFKTALDTAVGEKKKLIEVTECPHHVLVTIIDFLYGTEIPDDLSLDDLKSLLCMADLYLMEDLKEAASSSIGKKLTAENILEMFQLGEKYTAEKLKDLCKDFLIADKKRVDLASIVMGANLRETFKKRRDFKSDEEYRAYFAATVKPNMIVQYVKARAIGRVVSVESRGDSVVVVVKWQSGSSKPYPLSEPIQFEILTPPININFDVNKELFPACLYKMGLF